MQEKTQVHQFITDVLKNSKVNHLFYRLFIITLGEGHSSRSSSTEPTATINPLSLIKEEPDCDNLFNDKPVKGISENTDTLIEDTQESERTRRDSGESVGGFAAIAGVQKSSNADERTEDFSSIADSSPVPPVDDSTGQNPAISLPDTTAVPGRYECHSRTIEVVI